MVGKTHEEVKHRFSPIHLSCSQHLVIPKRDLQAFRRPRCAEREHYTSLKSKLLNFQGDFLVRRESQSNRIIAASNSTRIATS